MQERERGSGAATSVSSRVVLLNWKVDGRKHQDLDGLHLRGLHDGAISS